MKEGLFFIEAFSEDYFRQFKVKELLYEGKTKFQFVQCFSNEMFGKVLFLDHKIQSAQIDEFVYHESLVHPALLSHPEPKKVLIIGGGEGAVLREVLRHGTVEKAVMVDIDEQLTSICRKYLPEWSAGAFEDPKTSLIIRDARKYLERPPGKFDVIISDLTEPLEKGPSVYLFTEEFFSKAFSSLKKDGIFVLQAGSADNYYYKFCTSCKKTLDRVFPFVRVYWNFMFSFGSPWAFVIAGKTDDFLNLSEVEILKKMKTRKIKGLKYYHP